MKTHHDHLFGLAQEIKGPKTRYAICGLSKRALVQFFFPLFGSGHFPQLGDFSDYSEVVGLLDLDVDRINTFTKTLGKDFPTFGADQFDAMVEQTHPDVVIVAGPDGTHAEYIVKALERDIDVLTEKPMVIDCAQARRVINAERQSKASVRVTFNYRYTQTHMAIKRMIMQGLLGRITNVELVWNLDTFHGSTFYYRWNRERSKSGGVSISKCCHHFDLVNWWLNDLPREVFAFGGLNYFGANSPYNPSRRDGKDYTVQQQKQRCPYYQRWNAKWSLPPADDHVETADKLLNLPYMKQYIERGKPMYIYDPEIDIEDTYSAVVRYQGGATLSYSANFSAPWEGYTLGINGTHGRIEAKHITAPGRCPFTTDANEQVFYYPLFGQRQTHEIRKVSGSHGGGDPLLKHEMFIGEIAEYKDLGLLAGAEAGAYAIAVGEAVWRSVVEKRVVNIPQLLGLEQNNTGG